jgi:hypothetical protein
MWNNKKNKPEKYLRASETDMVPIADDLRPEKGTTKNRLLVLVLVM